MSVLRIVWWTGFFLALVLTGCGGGVHDKKDAGSKTYPIKGKVTAVNADPGKPTVKLDHEDIPGAMNAMEMEFPVSDAKALKNLKVGDQVQGKLEKRDSGFIIIELEKR